MKLNFLLGIITLFIVLLCCSGCYSRIELEDSIAAVAHGLDISPDGTQVISSGQFALPPQADEEEAPKFLIRSASGPTFSAAEQVIRASLPRHPVWSKAETYIIGENIARRNIGLFLDRLGRTNAVRETSLLFLAYQSTPEEVMSTRVEPEDNAEAALSKLIRGQEPQTGIYRPVSINEFLYKVSAEGIEPVLPQVKIESLEGKNGLTIDGLAVFRGRQMVGSLNEQESRGYHLINHTTRGGLFNITLPDSSRPGGQSKHTLELTSSRASVQPLYSQGQLTMKITIIAEGNLFELDTPQSLIDMAQLSLFEQQGSEALKSDIAACIDRAQAYQSDILGWGQILQGRQPALWESLKADWPAQFAGIAYEIECEYKLRRTYIQGRGIIEE